MDYSTNPLENYSHGLFLMNKHTEMCERGYN